MLRLKGLSSLIARGIAFGIIAFFLAMVGITVMTTIFGRQPPMHGSMLLLAAGSMIEHLVFGVAVVLIIDNTSARTALFRQ